MRWVLWVVEARCHWSWHWKKESWGNCSQTTNHFCQKIYISSRVGQVSISRRYQGSRKILNSSLPFGQAAFKFCLPECKSYNTFSLISPSTCTTSYLPGRKAFFFRALDIRVLDFKPVLCNVGLSPYLDHLSSVAFKGTQSKYRSLCFSTNVAFIEWRPLWGKKRETTTYLWACAHRVENMNALFLERHCSELNQVTLLYFQHTEEKPRLKRAWYTNCLTLQLTFSTLYFLFHQRHTSNESFGHFHLVKRVKLLRFCLFLINIW